MYKKKTTNPKNWNLHAYSLMVKMGEHTDCCINRRLHTITKKAQKARTRGETGRGQRRKIEKSRALGQQVSVWRQGMTDASVSVPTVATLWEQRRCPPSPFPLGRLWCGANKTGAVLSAVEWPHWHSTTCGQGGEAKVMKRPRLEPEAWGRSQRRWRQGIGVINVGVSARGQGKGSLSQLWEPAETWGPWRSCLWGKQMFSLRGVPSLWSNLQLLGGQVFNKGAGHGTFWRQMLQLWYNNILIMTVDHRAEGCSGTYHPTGLEPLSGWH